jgi:acetyltransferase-like isoleucine patch superfamily enzyme
MRENIIQSGNRSGDGRTYIEYDWFGHGIPGNVNLAEHVYIDTSYGFAAFHSELPDAMTMGRGSGCYDRASFVVGEKGKIQIGEFNILNGSVFICRKKIVVGSHCMFAWGSVITDCWINENNFSAEQRRRVLKETAQHGYRILPHNGEPKEIIIDDNVWVGFDTVVLPGVKLGRGCVIGSKSVVATDVPPYAVVVGNPSRVIRYLEPGDTEEARAMAMNEYLLNSHTSK